MIELISRYLVRSSIYGPSFSILYWYLLLFIRFAFLSIAYPQLLSISLLFISLSYTPSLHLFPLNPHPANIFFPLMSPLILSSSFLLSSPLFSLILSSSFLLSSSQLLSLFSRTMSIGPAYVTCTNPLKVSGDIPASELKRSSFMSSSILNSTQLNCTVLYFSVRHSTKLKCTEVY